MDEAGEESGIFAFEEEDTAGESVTGAVAAGGCFAGIGCGARGGLGVEAIGVDLGC
jgi:hypothetical protein